MGENKMKVHYDPEVDILYIVIKEGPIKDTIDINDDIFIEIAEDETIAGIEIWRASKNIAEPIATKLAEKIKKALEIKA